MTADFDMRSFHFSDMISANLLGSLRRVMCHSLEVHRVNALLLEDDRDPVPIFYCLGEPVLPQNDLLVADPSFKGLQSSVRKCADRGLAENTGGITPENSFF